MSLERGGLTPKGDGDARGTGYRGKNHKNAHSAGDKNIPTIERSDRGNSEHALGSGYRGKSHAHSKESGGKSPGEIVDRNYSYKKASVPKPTRTRDGVNMNLKRG